MATWKYIGTEHRYKEVATAGQACSVFECPYCHQERRVPSGETPKLNVCMNKHCLRKIEPLMPIVIDKEG